MDCNPPGSSVYGNFQARILEWVAIPFSRGSFWPRDQTWVCGIAGIFFTIWATREAPHLSIFYHNWKKKSEDFSSAMEARLCTAEQGFPTSGISCLMTWGGADVIIIEIMYTINVMCLNHPQNHLPTTLWPTEKNHLPQNQSLVPEKLGTASVEDAGVIRPDPLYRVGIHHPQFLWVGC